MFAVDTMLPTDTSSLYEAVASGDTINVVHSYAKALRHAFSAVSNTKNRAEKSGKLSFPVFPLFLLTLFSVQNDDEYHPLFSAVAEEKVDEFFTNCSGPASHSQPLSFSIGNYCWQHLLQTSLPCTMDISNVQVQEINAIIDDCLSQTNMNRHQLLPTDVFNSKKANPPFLNPASKAIKQCPLQQSNFLQAAHIHEEDIKYLARVLSNSRPPSSFIHSEPPRRTSNAAESQVLYDGSHGKFFWELVNEFFLILLNFLLFFFTLSARTHQRISCTPGLHC